MLLRLIVKAKANLPIVFSFGVLFLILLLNSVHDKYPDEFDNILGGYLINHGELPYRDFFSHHGPLAYFLAGILTGVTGQSFVGFRILTAGVFLLIFIATYLVWTRRTTLPRIIPLAYTLTAGLGATYFWGHMFLADPLAGYLIVPAYGLLVAKIFKKEALTTVDLWLISLFTGGAVLVSMTYTYTVMVIIGGTFLSFISSQKGRDIKELAIKMGKFAVIMATPYLVFFLYLLITGSVEEFYYQAVQYNQRYYIYNYPRDPGVTTINPVRYAIVIFTKFTEDFRILLTGVLNPNLNNPFNLSVAVVNAAILLVFTLQRRLLLAGLTLFSLAFSTVRSNLFESKATDYQSAVYFLITFFNASFLIYFFREELEKVKDYSRRLVLSVVLLTFGLYWLFTLMFLFQETWRWNYLRYMGRVPLIYDRPQIANTVNAVTNRDEYCWVGPFEFEEMFYLDCKLPSKYHWILPQFAGIPQIKSELISEFSKNRPRVIVYNRQYSAFGQSADFSGFFLEWLDKNYISLKDIGPNKYRFNSGNTENFNLDESFAIDRSKEEETVKILLEKGLIQEL